MAAGGILKARPVAETMSRRITMLNSGQGFTANLVTGSFIIEQLFSIPGVGRLFIQSIEGRDYGMIMGTTLFYAAIIAVANLMVDITYAVVDPRIRYD